MLYTIAMTDDDNQFMKCINSIKKSFYDEDDYNTIENIKELPKWAYDENMPDEEGQIKEVNDSLKKLVSRVCGNNGGKYIHCSGEDYNMPFPFIERYHHYFLKRKWEKPIRDPQKPINSTELFRLHKLQGEKEFQNYSKNQGDHNHFINVVAATARLINYLSEKENVLQFICPKRDLQGQLDSYCESVKFDLANHAHRIFTLMLSAFYHDIGKTVVYHRHGMEGAIIISEHTSKSWYQLNRIFQRYGFDEEFDRDDLLFISDLLDYHDQFGTLSTGEAGYTQLVDIVERIKRYSIKYESKEDQKIWSQRFLFDLWVLNLADIMVSIEQKWEYQKEWENKKLSNKKISQYLSKHKKKADNLSHDLHIALKILDIINEHRHTDTYSKISHKSQQYSDRHAVERIRRLIYSSLESVIIKDHENQKEKKGYLNNIQNILSYLNDKKSLSEAELTAAIVRSIKSTREFGDFCNRFSWIGQMDYSLGFFNSICSRALFLINREIGNNQQIANEKDEEYYKNFCFRTKWIRDKFSDSFGTDQDSKSHLDQLQSKLFVENFTITVIQIIDHLLYREEKIDAIISLNGPYHAKISIQKILQTVFIY